MKELWNEFCYELRPCLQNNVLEKDYENTLTNCLAYLGWKKHNGEITTQYPIQVGHEKKYADIVISKDMDLTVRTGLSKEDFINDEKS